MPLPPAGRGEAGCPEGAPPADPLLIPVPLLGAGLGEGLGAGLAAGLGAGLGAGLTEVPDTEWLVELGAGTDGRALPVRWLVAGALATNVGDPADELGVLWTTAGAALGCAGAERDRGLWAL